MYALRRAGQDAEEDSDIVSQHIKSNFYVDYWLASFQSEEETISHGRVLTNALACGGFVVSQLGTSSKAFLAALSDKPNKALNLDLEELPVE